MRRLVLIAFGLGVVAFANASSLNLSYTKTSLGSLFQYDMSLSIDTSVTGFTPGEGWGWIVFGDVASGTSPLSDFDMTVPPTTGPWSNLSGTTGGHNGPTLGPVADSFGILFWTPGSASDVITWSGTSAFDAPDNSLFFSSLIPENGATAADFKLMTSNPVPEPASLAILGAGVAALIRKKRQRR